MMRLRRELAWNPPCAWSALFVICAPLLLHPAQAAAQGGIDDGTRAAVRELGQQGIDAYLAGNYAAANRKLDKAYQLFVAQYDSLRTVSSVAFWAGAVCAVGGVVTWLAALKSSAENADGLSWHVGPFGVDVRGAL